MQAPFPLAREQNRELIDAPRFVQIACTGQTHGGGIDLYALDAEGVVWEYSRGPDPYWYPLSTKASLSG